MLYLGIYLGIGWGLVLADGPRVVRRGVTRAEQKLGANLRPWEPALRAAMLFIVVPVLWPFLGDASEWIVLFTTDEKY